MNRYVIAILAAACCAVPAAWADEASALRADQLKAGYVFNFAKFVEWSPTAATEPLTVCFLGAAGVHDAFAMDIRNKRAGTRPMAARRIETLDEVPSCDVLYVDAQALNDEGDAPTTPGLLTVSDAKAFVRRGGVIELFTDSNRLRFNVNVGNAQRAGLRISSNLLQLAAAVEKEGAK